MARFTEFLRRLDTHRLTVHITPPARVMLRAMAASLSGVSGLLPRLLMRPALADIILRLLGERGRIFDPLIHNSVSPTILQGSDKINVIPGRASVELDGRRLPGFQPEDLINARFFSRLGIQSCGFTPMALPEDFSFLDTIHAADERIPVDALAFGTDAIYELLGRFGD